MGDVLDPPARGAEDEHVADARLVDHLLVQLADPGTALAGEEHAEQAAVGNRPAGGDGQPLRARRAPDSVPSTRSQLIRGRSSANSSDG